jgi:hypothetical protein
VQGSRSTEFTKRAQQKERVRGNNVERKCDTLMSLTLILTHFSLLFFTLLTIAISSHGHAGVGNAWYSSRAQSPRRTEGATLIDHTSFLFLLSLPSLYSPLTLNLKGYMGMLVTESVEQFPPAGTQVKVMHGTSESTELTKNRANNTNRAHFISLSSFLSESRGE